MARASIDDTRLTPLNDDSPQRGRYVLYWMQQSQRAADNHALEYAAQQANALSLPLLVVFGLTDSYPDANLRHYRFMLEGLRDVRDDLAKRGIGFAVLRGQPAEVALLAARDAAMVVCDRGYLRHQRQWRDRVADAAGRRVVMVETDLVVPVEVASDKAEYAARTIRPKILRQLEQYLVELRSTSLATSWEDQLTPAQRVNLDDLDAVLASLNIDRTIEPNPQFVGGSREAKRLFRAFLRQRFGTYAENRNHPETDDVSHMSKYLHFGHISPVWLAMEARGAADPDDENVQSFIEELVVRRELAHNFVYYTVDYDRYSCLPSWARQTLKRHRDDKREHVYTKEQLAAGQTHDPYWNAAMKEMRETGYMHNYMRMYWGKKIIEWTNTPEYAHQVALELNNRYFIDGRDANSYTNIAWLFGQHDRPWQERPIFGNVRYMNARGLERKTDIDAYIRKVDRLVAELNHG